ncbi:Uu.00g015580.m01.CDS01 [Anthostomella pinea]|uniref:Uu.00g015580.m01.CDS01 n=1 Tax=Anthostomella pinea TaxID=933095 RepID=A0AAI8VZ72_9PEZI|nr:Uu.00g015580.m01.CDS01 [Anthostomella pinea]
MSPASADPFGAAESGSQGNSPSADAPPSDTPRNNSDIPKPKRLACMICRKRKLRCDGSKPSCSTCTRLGHTCAYDEVRKKSGPKRGYVKALEERLKQVETLLKTQDPSTTASPEATKTPNVTLEQTRIQQASATPNFTVTNPAIAIANDRDADRWHINGESPQAATGSGGLDDFNFAGNMSMGMDSLDPSFTWEMIGLGLEEPLPPQETIDELHQIYFEKIHPSLPMIHKFRYLTAMNLAPNQRPPVALRYAIWTLACSVTEKYTDLKDLFYRRARKYVEGDYIKGYGEHFISVAHCQTHVLLGSYEFKMMYFPRAWMSTGSAVRLSQMIGLHRLDGNGLDVKQCLPAPRDWTETEERRRTFWMAFCQDRYASIGTGWPMMVDERDISSNLPSSEEAFNMSRPEQMQTLTESMSPAGAGKLSSFGGIVLMACLFGRNLTHLHRPDADDRDHDMNGEFWKRHRNMDNILLNTSLCLPSHLKLPDGLGNPNIVFTNMNIHTSTICLHQAAIFKADRNRLPPTVSAESKVRCITAANEIASIMRMVSHLDLSAMNPFISFCLYVAARVFVQFLKSRPDDSQTADALRFLLSAMNALKRKNPLTESFLVQLDVDLEALGLRIPKLKSAFPRSTASPGPHPSLTKMQKNADVNGQPRSGNAGTMNFHDTDCNFLRTPGDDGNPLNAPNLVESETHNPNQMPQGWYPGEQLMSGRGRESGAGHGKGAVSSMLFEAGGFGESQSSETNDISGSSNQDGQSNRPTPNSSSASDHRQSTTGTGAMTNSDRPSFDASPNGSRAMEVAAAAYFPSAGFGMSGTGLSPGGTFSIPDLSGHDFSVPGGWDSEQAGMTPRTAEGIMQGIMNMPMEEMNWDSGV